jgi:ubiquinone/menaquinone biosynthesis C-methylase UbiE
VTEFDELAENYDRTRGGEARGDEYAAEIDPHLPPGDGTILEIGIGTGVVALGLRRRGRRVVGLDLSYPMIERALGRLGSVVVRSDAMKAAIATGSVAHAVSVWVIHSVADPVRLFSEARRVIRPGGRYVVCSAQRPAPTDEIGRLFAEMAVEVDRRRGAARPRGVTTEEVLGWAAEAGLPGTLHLLDRSWISSPEQELEAIRLRQWPALRELDEDSIAMVTRPVIHAIKAIAPGDLLRKGVVEMIVFEIP